MNPNHDMPPLESFSKDNQELVDGLRDGNEDVRLESLEEVTEADDGLADELIRIFRFDASEEVRAGAAIALGPTLEMCFGELDENGRLDDDAIYGAPLSQGAFKRVVDALREVHLDHEAPLLVRRRALEGSIRCPLDWHGDAVRTAWATGDHDWQLTAVFCMGYLFRLDFAAELDQAYRSDSLELQREALRAAAGLDHGWVRPEALRIVGDSGSPKELRYAAVDALGYVGRPQEMELLEELSGSRDRTLATWAENALENLRMQSGFAGMYDLDDDGWL